MKGNECAMSTPTLAHGGRCDHGLVYDAKLRRDLCRAVYTSQQDAVQVICMQSDMTKQNNPTDQNITIITPMPHPYPPRSWYRESSP